MSTARAIDDLALKAATNPRRRRILQLVWESELSSHQIAENFADVTWQSVSLNLKVLRQAGLVRERREGTSRLYMADRARCAPLESLLKTMWQNDLAQLSSVLESGRRRSKNK